jgi:pimeloyl-ACP methyl ester carboxylesterase
MVKASVIQRAGIGEARVRRGYFECRYGQLHMHIAIPPGGGFEEGAPLLCLHSAGVAARLFHKFLPFAGRDRSVYAPDLPGYGESDAPPQRATAAEHAAALGDFLDSMRFRQVDVLGYHAGSLIALELAIGRPQQIRRLALVGLPDVARERVSLMGSQPVMVLRPKDDLWESTQRVRERMPRARFVEMPEQGPSLFDTAPETVANAVRPFFEG